MIFRIVPLIFTLLFTGCATQEERWNQNLVLGFENFDNHNDSRAIEHLNIAISIAEQLNDHEKKAISHYELGRIYSRMGSFDLALEQLLIAENILPNIKNPRPMLHGQILVELLLANGEYRKSEKEGLAFAKPYLVELKEYLHSYSGHRDGTKLIANIFNAYIKLYEDAGDKDFANELRSIVGKS